MLLGARQFFERRGGGWQNPYVTDGLVAMWDGEWNAGGGVHDPNATVWKDLVGTRDATLSGTYSWGEKSWRRDNNSSTNAALPDIPIGAGLMIEYCSILNNAGDNNFRDFSNTTGGRFEIIQSSNGQLNVYYVNYNGTGVQRGFGVGTGTSRTSRTIAVGWDSLGIVYSVNGSSLGYDRTVNTPISSSYGNVGLNVGKYSSLYEDADYFSIRVYNRILADSEIAANYAIDKARFNLP